jgi:hypothetical protein
MESSSKVGWKDYSDEELGVSFSYPEDFVVTKENISVSPKFSSIIRVSYKGTALLTMQEQGYTVSIANVIAQRIADLERQYAANNIKWETSTKDKAPLIHYLYPISGDEGTRVDPIFYEIDDYGNNRMLVISLAYEALDPSVESDMKTIGGSLITGR